MATCQVAYGANFEPALSMITLAFGKFSMSQAVRFNFGIGALFCYETNISINQGVQQTLKTLKNLNNPKFDLVTLRTLNSTKLEQNDFKNLENYPQEILIQRKFPNLSPEVKIIDFSKCYVDPTF